MSLDGRWLVISASIGTAPREDVWIADLSAGDPARPAFTEVTVGLDAQTALRPGRDGRLYVFTDLDAPRARLAVTDPADPRPQNWRDLIPQDPEAVLRGYAILDGNPDKPRLLARWTRHAISEVTVHDLATGERLGTLSLPGIGSVGGIAERPEGGHEAWFSYTDYTTPPVVLRYDAVTEALETYSTAPGAAVSYGDQFEAPHPRRQRCDLRSLLPTRPSRESGAKSAGGIHGFSYLCQQRSIRRHDDYRLGDLQCHRDRAARQTPSWHSLESRSQDHLCRAERIADCRSGRR